MTKKLKLGVHLQQENLKLPAVWYITS